MALTLPANIEVLWAEYEADRSDAHRNRLAEIYLPLVTYLASRLKQTLPDEIEYDDMFSAGTLGLLQAIEGFDPKRGLRFETYCPLRIRGAMLDELRELDWVPRRARQRVSKLGRAVSTIERGLGRPPQIAETAYVLDMQPEECERLFTETKLTLLVSLSAKFYEQQSEHEMQQMDFLPDGRGEDPQEPLDRKEEMRRLTRDLSRQERLLVLLYYWEGLSMAKIGEVLGLSESRISQLHTKILARQKVALTKGAG